jgi:hypothetical protein
MRPTNSNTAGYQPSDPPADPAQLQRFLREELAKVKAAIDAVAAGQLDRIYKIPAKPRDGMIRYLDSTIAPGGVRGVYYYDSTAAAWKLLG